MRAKAFPGEDPTKLRAPDDIAKRFLDLASLSMTETGKVFGVV